MTHSTGTALGGIRTVEDLRLRCRIDDITGCWHWAGAHADGHPSLYLPLLRTRTTAGVAICVLLTGKRPAPGVYWHVTCETAGCCNPKHRRPGDRRAQMLAAKITKTPADRARIAAARRKRSSMTAEKARAIRQDPRVLRLIAADYGIDLTTASRIKRGELWRETTAGASVFSLGAA